MLTPPGPHTRVGARLPAGVQAARRTVPDRAGTVQPWTPTVAVGTGIELLQWALPLGRVVSPVDAALNAAGAVVAGLLVALSRGRSGGVVRRGLG